MNTKKVINILKNIFNHELAGVIRYTHYSLMIFGQNRLPLVQFFRAQAKESLMHAETAGEYITGLGGHPPLNIENIKETFKHDVHDILKETLQHEEKAIESYYTLLDQVKDESVFLEEFARTMIGQEELHVLEVKKMLKKNE
ncbi:MAG: ferritin-like domain-containing protein [Candidatus Neomarinimicrobiota bacterium]|jgi:bacterioferritin|nr:ferritin-like domain-containing protein [Candidatus Neomarinimicrobiota bacterium]